MIKLLVVITVLAVYASQNTQSLEEIYKNTLLKENARATSKFLSSKAHVASTPEDEETSEYVADQFRQFGISTFKKEYYPLLHFPVSTQLQLLEPTVYNATLIETNSSQIPWLAYSPSANVLSSLVYANYGAKEDFDLLKMNGINVTGRIVLVKYGIGFRGLKVRAAEEAGAAAVLIYSDPEDDGFVKGPVFPGMSHNISDRWSVEAFIRSSERIYTLSKLLSRGSFNSRLSCNKGCTKDSTRRG